MTEKLAPIRLLALDVDGTLTDGGVTYSDDPHQGSELKQFHIHDGLGIVLAGFAGLQIAWITGRTSPVVARRARELKVTLLRQGVRDKVAALQEVAALAGVTLAQTAYMGDDLNDLPALHAAGAAIAPANAVLEVAGIAAYVTPRSGGQGAVRDAIEEILRVRGDYDQALAAYLASLITPAATPTQ